MTVTIGFIGAGKMAEAMMAAWLNAGLAEARSLMASDRDPARRRLIAERFGAATTASNAEAAASDLVVLAVKPQHLNDVLSELPAGAMAGRLVVSILAGKRTGSLENAMPGARVVRVMPNLPCVVGEGMCAFCAGSSARPDDLARVRGLLGASGKVMELPEDRFDAVTALSGSGPAFFAYVLDRLADGAVGEGLSREEALLLAEQTMLGTARLLMDQGMDPKALIASVASARGTTAAGLAVLDASDMRGVLNRTIAAAAQRSRELSS
jgi:pyrroline-5-carboxylate reductase